MYAHIRYRAGQMRKKHVEKTETTREVVTNVFCDMCGDEKIVTYADSWNGSETDVNFVTVTHTIGTEDRSKLSGTGKEIVFDICPRCFRSKVLNFLYSECRTPPEYQDWKH